VPDLGTDFDLQQPTLTYIDLAKPLQNKKNAGQTTTYK
jgi:hypothetical protein